LDQLTVTPGPNRSLALDGTSGYVEVPGTDNLNLTCDWTVEAWFKDEDPNGFNHDYRQILIKGDQLASAEAPYYVLVGRNNILVGTRAAGQNYPLSYNLAAAGLDPRDWHHVAATFRADLNVLNLWLDGRHITWLRVPTHSVAGNGLPLQIGRAGPRTGKYWQGKLDDVRIWKIARADADITATFAGELPTSPPQVGLVANWKFNERLGTLAAYSAVGSQTAILSTTGATFSTDVHP
jgi:hypothetical protein